MEDFVPTRCAQVNKNLANDFVSVKYTAHKKKIPSPNDDSKSKLEPDAGKTSVEDARRQQEREMKRLRWDVMKFGTSGFSGARKNKAKVALVLQLGGKPVKSRKNENYRELKVKKAREKARIERIKKRESGFAHSLVKVNAKTKRKKESGILDVYGKVEKKKNVRR
ncbi:uncharacterized protein LOC107038890 [Diachasma alloeum]|uniref:uncharacterized protein LOC107038890 n=1 Tax=Diachasma alloeum TaxID=454923 RepID=UPI000738148D|nr:uncharacterized protein LOC107038890 [Diachasma alloeum]